MGPPVCALQGRRDHAPGAPARACADRGRKRLSRPGGPALGRAAPQRGGAPLRPDGGERLSAGPQRHRLPAPHRRPAEDRDPAGARARCADHRDGRAHVFPLAGRGDAASLGDAGTARRGALDHLRLALPPRHPRGLRPDHRAARRQAREDGAGRRRDPVEPGGGDAGRRQERDTVSAQSPPRESRARAGSGRPGERAGRQRREPLRGSRGDRGPHRPRGQRQERDRPRHRRRRPRNGRRGPAQGARSIASARSGAPRRSAW